MTDLKQLYRTAVTEHFPDTITVSFNERPQVYRKVTWAQDSGESSLRYGENPHQPAACYVPESAAAAGVTWLKQGKGGASWTNLADIDHGSRILRYCERPAVAVMKHLNPAGVAEQRGDQRLVDLFERAWRSDDRAAFGSVVVMNRPLDRATAEDLATKFVEVVAAPGFDADALDALAHKRDLRLATIRNPHQGPKFAGDPVPFDIKMLADGSMLVQAPYVTRIRSADDLIIKPIATMASGLTVRGEWMPEVHEEQDLLFAWYVAGGVRSNAVVIVKDGRTLAVGTGEQERIGAIEQAIAKARQKGHGLNGAVLASDGFFPFRDAVDAIADAGITAIIQPGGSVRDGEVLAACNDREIAMVFTGERCFSHF
jgi:phosphoribosylaminoimidazolecarboxamide formyltransferase/IMP cyclohydrolase